ncbi:MAG: polyprenyl synthetase family protein, partial [Chloroflexota bacterium]|nr:polyprenyl synthetase family protein [Chloroflexota bacterium]
MLHGLDERTASIYSPVRDGLARVDDRLRSLAETETSPVQPLLQYVTDAGGKRVRPAITLLAAQFHPHDEERPIIMASAVELLHLATLIHDDTVDNSPLRRGRATVSNTWSPHVAVLFGDYVFATSATFVCDTNNIRVIRRFSETIMELASGQLMEYYTSFDASQARDIYQDRIYRKTASLFCTASESGAVLGEAPENEVEALRDYGYNIGMAFQVRDDLLDFQGDPSNLGKPVGSDLLNGVLTLPTIMLMERYPNDDLVQS